MGEWVDIVKSFLAEYWLVLVIGMLILYYLFNFIMLLVSVVIFPVSALGASFWSLGKMVHWPDDDENRMTPRNFFFFLAGTLAFIIEIWLFSLFLEYYLLGESIMPLFGNTGVRMSVVSGIGFGMLTLIFGHLAHHLLSKPKEGEPNATEENGVATKSDRIVGWASAAFFLIATLVLGYSGGLRAHTLAQAVDASIAVVIFSVAIGAIFGFMMPFGAVVGMSRGGFLWHILRNVLLGLPIVFGLLLLIVAAFVFYLVEVILTIVTLPISQLFTLIAGFCGFKPNKPENADELEGWKIGMNHLLSSAHPPEGLQRFLDLTRKNINFWTEPEPMVREKAS